MNRRILSSLWPVIPITAFLHFVTTNSSIAGRGSREARGSGDQTRPAATLNRPSLRTRYVRTDAATEYFTLLNGSWIVYDSVRKRIFVSDPGGNRISVLDPTSESAVGSIAVPGAFGIDETPDQSILYAGTLIGDVYAINPATMQVTRRYLAAQIGPRGYHASSVRVLANGDLALQGSQGGIPTLGSPGVFAGVDGYPSVAVWNPAENSIATYGNDVDSKSFCTEGLGLGIFTLTGDRSLIVVGSIDGGLLCTLNPSTGQGKIASTGASLFFSVAATPDGKLLLAPGDQGIAVFNAKTLARTATIHTQQSGTLIVSPDSKTLFVGSESILYAYDIASGKQVGWMPNLVVEPTSGGFNLSPSTSPIIQAFDDTGLLAGPMEEGVGFLDTTTLRTGPVGSQFSNDYLVPATGPSAGGTQTEWVNSTQSAILTSVYFGENPATSVSQGDGEFYATSPDGPPGPVDVYALAADGGMLILPEGFSYGPTIIEVTPDASPSEGGGTGVIYGYGLGPIAYDAPIPKDLRIAVGGRPAVITGFDSDAYATTNGTPFPLEAATYIIPPGAEGSTAEVAVTTQYGTANASGAMRYLPSVRRFPIAGASLAQGIFDARRDVYYFTDTSEIRVFSRAEGKWLGSIRVPAPPAGKTHRLWGIALSPDGSKLAVSDERISKIYLIDPDSTSLAKSFPVLPYSDGTLENGQGFVTNPAGLDISNSGTIYYTAFTAGINGFDGFFKLDTATGAIVDYRMVTFGGNLYRAAITSDNSRVFFNDDGAVFSVDTATDEISDAADDQSCCYGDYDLALSAKHATLEASSYLYDTDLNAKSYLVLSDRDALNISYVYGVKLSPDGRLLFQPSTNGIDVFDGRIGTLRQRISLPVALSQNFDALVSDGRDNVLIAITGKTGTGIAVIDLSSLAEPPALPYPAELDKMDPLVRASTIGSDHLAATRALAKAFGGRRTPRPVVRHVANGDPIENR